MVDRVTRIDLPGRQWKAGREKTVEADQRMPYFVAGPENRLVVVAVESLLLADGCRLNLPSVSRQPAVHLSSTPRPIVASADKIFPKQKMERENPWVLSASKFNPLILLGATGCGKSHLAGGIANHWHAILSENVGQSARSAPANRSAPAKKAQTRSPTQKPFRSLTFQHLELSDLLHPKTGECGSRQVAYLSANEFGRLVQQAREQNKLAGLQLALARLRLLVLEELHQIRLNRVMQQKLRLTIDKLLANGGIVLATSQRPLAMVASLEGGLRDRLSAGLTVRIKPPGAAARLEILQLAAKRRGNVLDLDHARRLSQQIVGSASQLFQALARLELPNAGLPPHIHKQYCAGTHPDGPNSQVPNSSVKNPCPEAQPLQPHTTMRQIIAVVARYFSVSQTQIRGQSRRHAIVHARCVTVFLARILTNLSYAQIGHHLGNRDHTTTMHANRKIQRMFSTDSLTQECIEDLKRILAAG